mgnify:CR=1 FL=1
MRLLPPLQGLLIAGAAAFLLASSPLHAQPEAGAGVPSAAAKARMAAADQGRILGAANAPLWVVIFSDFQCPYCKRWHDATDAVLRERYVKTGKVRLAFLNFPLRSHQHAQPAGEAAMCAAAQGKFWEFHDAVFSTQQKWSPMGDAGQVLDSIAAAVKLDVPQYKSCRAERQMRLLVESDFQRGGSAGVQGTPAFFIGSRGASGAIPTADFLKIVDEELAKVAPAKR